MPKLKIIRKDLKMKKLSVIALMVFALTTFLSAQPAGMNGKMGMKQGMMNRHNFLLEKLKLTPDQKEKIAGLKMSFQSNMIDLRASLAKDKLSLKELRLKGDFTRDDVLNAVEKINKDKDAISVAFANHMLDIYALLTPDQQKIAKNAAFNNWGEKQRMGNNFHRRGMMN